MEVKFLDAIFKILVLQPRISPVEEAAASIVNRYSGKSTRIFTVDIDISNDFVASLEVSAVINSPSAAPPRLADSYLVISRLVESAIYLIDSMNSFEKDASWIIVLSNNDNLSGLFERFFNNGILNLVAVCTDNDLVNIYTYFPFTPKTCYDFQPVLVDQFIEGKFIQHVNLFPPNKMKNLHQCPLSVLLFPVPPEVRFAGNEPPLSDELSELFSLVRLKMNFTPEFSHALSIPNGTDEMMRNRRIISIGLVSFAARLDHGSPLAYRCFTWCIPAKFCQHRGMDVLTKTFQWNVRLACLVSIVATAGVIWYLFNHSAQTSSPWMVLFSVIVEQVPSHTTERDKKVRFFIVTLSIAFLVINTMFKARLHSLMTAPRKPIKMTEYAHLYSSKLILYSFFDNDWLADSIGNWTIGSDRLRRWDQVNSNSTEEVQKALREGTGALLVKADYCHRLANKLGRTHDGYHKVYTLPLCVSSAAATYFSFAPNSPFANRVREVTANLREFGLSERLLTEPLTPEFPSTEPVPIGLEDVEVVLIMWFFGLLCSVIAFFVEYFLNRQSTTSDT